MFNTSSSVNNKRIAKNTLFLYLRMLVVMGIGLYTVRAILHLLGVVDYGIYNVVGGVVGMFAFLNSTLATSSQRYFSIELAKGDLDRLNKWFCLNISTFSIFIVIFVAIAETVGLWFVNTQMTIPKERMFAANVVYQLSIVSFCVSLFSIPYNALIIAHERMSAFAFISIIEALTKLAIVFILSLVSWDRLIVYGILMFFTSCAMTSSYILYNRRYFPESKFHLYWNKSEFIEIIGFSGWHFWGTFSMVIRSQGINILLNLFFNPAVNAARAVAYQVYHAVVQLSENFFVAVKPQIYKAYASGDNEALFKLVLRSSILSSLLVSILVFPILSNTQYVLGLWLEDLPEYTVIFTQLVLINGLIDSTNGPLAVSVLASGKIRNYELLVATTIMMNLPISYVALKLGVAPQATMIVSICISIVTTFNRAFIMCKKLNVFLGRYVVTFLRLVLAAVIIGLISYMTVYDKSETLWQFIWQSMFIFLLTAVVYAIIAFDKNDVKLGIQYIKQNLK